MEAKPSVANPPSRIILGQPLTRLKTAPCWEHIAVWRTCMDTEMYTEHYINRLGRRQVAEMVPQYRLALLAQIKRVTFISNCRFRSQENNDMSWLLSHSFKEFSESNRLLLRESYRTNPSTSGNRYLITVMHLDNWGCNCHTTERSLTFVFTSVSLHLPYFLANFYLKNIK